MDSCRHSGLVLPAKMLFQTCFDLVALFRGLLHALELKFGYVIENKNLSCENAIFSINLVFRWNLVFWSNTAQKMKFSINDFLSKCDQIPRKLQIWSHLLKKSLMENFISCAVKKSFSKRKTKYFNWNTRFLKKIWQMATIEIDIC